MTDEQFNKMILLLETLVEETKKHTLALEDVKNLFVKYDTDLLMQDEFLREG